MSKPTNKDFQLKFMSDMLDIPEDRFDEFLIDLKKWHNFGSNFKNLVAGVASAVGEELPDEFMTMRWLDDGIHSGKVVVNVKEEPKS